MAKVSWDTTANVGGSHPLIDAHSDDQARVTSELGRALWQAFHWTEGTEGTEGPREAQEG